MLLLSLPFKHDFGQDFFFNLLRTFIDDPVMLFYMFYFIIAGMILLHIIYSSEDDCCDVKIVYLIVELLNQSLNFVLIRTPVMSIVFIIDVAY